MRLRRSRRPLAAALCALAALTAAGCAGSTSGAAGRTAAPAASYADQVVVLRDGRVAGHGPPLEVLNPGFIEEVFGVRAYVGPHPITGRPHIAVASREG
ncbi:hypothetical protein ABZ907_40155 [Nonomuraea wenchangensis]